MLSFRKQFEVWTMWQGLSDLLPQPAAADESGPIIVFLLTLSPRYVQELYRQRLEGLYYDVFKDSL